MADPGPDGSGGGEARPDGPGPWGDPALHLPLAELERRLAALPPPPRDSGTLALVVARVAPGRRETPPRVVLTPQQGVPGDAWSRKDPRKLDAQLALMRADVARLFANGQGLTLFGDNLLVDLDLSAENLPPGTRLGVGAALLEVTAEPHTGCRKFRQRAGADALRLTAERRYRSLRLRGIYARVVRAGEVAAGDAITVLGRGGGRAARAPEEGG